LSLSYDFRKASNIIDSLSQAELVRLDDICMQIQTAEAHLNDTAKPSLERCMSQCKGLCCRNIHLNEIICVADFVFVLMVEDKLRPEMTKCLENAQLFSADCIFLQNSVGPCLFPDISKPQICICTFCGDDEIMKKEIREVRAAFNALSRFLLFRKPRAILRRCRGHLPFAT